MDRLQDVPNRVREIASHGIRHGAATALATVQTRYGRDLYHLQPVIPEGEDAIRDFNDLLDYLGGAVEAIAEEISSDAVTFKVFQGD